LVLKCYHVYGYDFIIIHKYENQFQVWLNWLMVIGWGGTIIVSVSNIPEKIKIRLWGIAAGRCQYEGCNKPLWLDTLTKYEFNVAYIAHIIADSPDGPRGDPELSFKLKADISNLLLMCDKHHRLIDREDVVGHPPERLHKMKRMHEERIALVTSLSEEKRSHVILYGANIGQHHVLVSWEKAFKAMLPNWYPAQKPAIELSLKNSSFQDHESSYWLIEREQLRRQFAEAVKPLLAMGQVQHFSILALAPQPLLIELGRLLSDIPAAEVYQLHREPPDWIWQDIPGDIEFIVHEPACNYKQVALNLSLSATIDNSRIISVLGEEVSIWTLTIKETHNDFLKSREQLCLFRSRFRKLLDQIKLKHGQDSVLNLFPAVPVSVAVEIGRVWMPKADLSMNVYDQNNKSIGFLLAFNIS